MLMDAKNKCDVLLVGLVAFVGYAAAQGNLPTCVSDCGTVAAQAVGCASMYVYFSIHLQCSEAYDLSL